MRRRAALWCAVLSVLVCCCACLVNAPPPGLTTAGSRVAVAEAPLVGRGKPLDFSLKRHPEGRPWRLSSERGQVVLLDVWATWCEPCRAALPLYQDFLKEFGAQGLRVYAVNVDADVRAVEPFLRENRLTLPVLLDPEARLSEVELGVRMMPTTLLIDRRGVVRAVHEGFEDGATPKYLRDIEALLKEPRHDD
jgi:thiol-disulfide isomerase/thioredoxin